MMEPESEQISQQDRRPRMREPLPVKLVTVDDATLSAAAGIERELDAFYVDLLGFERVSGQLVYEAENYRIIFEVLEPPIARDDLRILQIEVLSLPQTVHKLIEAKIEYTHKKSLNAGQESLLLRDPAGNWLEIVAPVLLR